MTYKESVWLDGNQAKMANKMKNLLTDTIKQQKYTHGTSKITLMWRTLLIFQIFVVLACQCLCLVWLKTWYNYFNETKFATSKLKLWKLLLGSHMSVIVIPHRTQHGIHWAHFIFELFCLAKTSGLGLRWISSPFVFVFSNPQKEHFQISMFKQLKPTISQHGRHYLKLLAKREIQLCCGSSAGNMTWEIQAVQFH